MVGYFPNLLCFEGTTTASWTSQATEGNWWQCGLQVTTLWILITMASMKCQIWSVHRHSYPEWGGVSCHHDPLYVMGYFDWFSAFTEMWNKSVGFMSFFVPFKDEITYSVQEIVDAQEASWLTSSLHKALQLYTRKMPGVLQWVCRTFGIVWQRNCRQEIEWSQVFYLRWFTDTIDLVFTVALRHRLLVTRRI